MPARLIRNFLRAGARMLHVFLFIVGMVVMSRAVFAVEVRVQVADYLTESPIGGAAVQLLVRHTTVDEKGEIHLLPLMEVTHLDSAESGSDGRVAFEVDVGEPAFLAIEVSMADYETAIETLLLVRPGENVDRRIRLVRSNPTMAEREAFVAKHEMERRGEMIDQGPYLAPGVGQLRAMAVTVPDEVRVENLNGFTGMINLDEFIGGVVTREMSDGFPREALRAQAVASRSYALHRLRTRGYANGGQAYNSVSGSLSRAAAFYTSKQVLLYNGAIAQAFFSARCNGDFTLDSEDGPTLDRCFPGGLTTAVVPYCRSKPCSGHINCSETTERCCVLTINSKTNYIYGHGIGLCQRGAQQFATRDRLTYPTILERFYTGVILHTGTNALQLSIVALAEETAQNPVVIQVRSGQPETAFDLQSTPTLTNPTWSSIVTERGLNTGPGAMVQIEPQGATASGRYYRALLR